ncbi:MAG: Cell division ATP-binding protein FtsE [Alphaproteobacteria bacterium MarineAlpha2_Bin1]|nr:MAG: Cell division ATP-binding protein FtsE [Alphaproteobacteria bacterium MarineAlpha2_Bin1]
MIKLSKIYLNYGNNADILKNLDLKLTSGSFHFLTGPSGSGKSSLLKLLFLGHVPTSGKLSIFGKDISEISKPDLPILRRKIGVVFQDFRLLDHLTVIENVALPLQIAGARNRDIKDHVNELITWVGLNDKIDAFPNTLSDGEKQRIAIARAVIGRPSLLLADEPTGSIDSNQGDKIMHLFEELNKIGTTVIIATHDNSLVSQFDYPKLNLVNGKINRNE